MDSTTNTPSTARVALKYGLLTGMALVILYMVMNLTGLAFTTNKGISLFNSLGSWVVIPCIGLVLAMKDFKSQNSGYMSYGQGLGVGSLLGGVTGAVLAIFSTLYNSFIDPTAIPRALEIQRQALEEQNTIDDAQIDQAMVLAEKALSPGVAIPVTIVMMVFVCFIYSLILSAIVKKEQNELQV
jgi:hypothetical protein